MSGIGGLVSSIFGSSNDDAKTVDPYQVNGNAYQYGGQPGGAQAAAGLQGQRAQGSIEYGNVLQGQQAQSYGQSQDSRAQQQQALDMAKQRAQGQNLISSQITQQQQQQAAAQQAGLAASARGPAALAQAQQQQAANTGQATAQLGAQGAIAGAQEQLANQQAFAAQAAGMRGQDLGAAAQSGQLALGNQQVAQGWAGLQNNINQAQLAAQMNQQAQQSANYNAAHGIQAGASGQNAALNQQNGLALVGGVASGGSSLLGGGGGKARGGSLPAEGKPYLVGEEGPELVIPKRDGFVMTALQTAALRGAPPTAQQLASLSPGGRRAAGGPLLQRSHAVNAPPPGDPNAPRMQFDPRAGWYAAGAPSAPASIYGPIDGGETDRQAARDLENAEMDRKIAALPADQARVKRFIDEDVQAAKTRKGESSVPSIIEIIGRDGKSGGRRPRVATAGKSFGDQLIGASGNVDIGYHAPAAPAGPQLIALPQARAAGGDFDAGNGMMLKKTGGLDLPATYAATQDINMSGMKNASSNPTFGGGAAGAAGAFGGALLGAAKGVDVSLHPIEAREDGGSILSSIATHATRALHSIASAAADATAPESIAIEKKTPRAGVTERTGYSATGTGHGAAAQTTATLVHPGPETAPKKVVDGEDARARGGVMKAYAKGGMMLGKGGRKRKAA